MSRKTIKGLVSIQLGAIAGDGGVSTAFAAFGSTVKRLYYLHRNRCFHAGLLY